MSKPTRIQGSIVKHLKTDEHEQWFIGVMKRGQPEIDTAKTHYCCDEKNAQKCNFDSHSVFYSTVQFQTSCPHAMRDFAYSFRWVMARKEGSTGKGAHEAYLD
jgi:hypothetical protein